MTQPYYKPSGKFAGVYFLYYVLFTFICVPILSAIYIYLIHYIPFIYLNVLIAIGCGVALGYMMLFAAKNGKARNPAVVLLLSILALLIMKYIQWCIYIPLIYDNVYEVFYPGLTLGERFVESAYLFVRPGLVYELAAEINEFGAWSFGDNDVNGVMLLVVWTVEFLIMAVCALVIPRLVAKKPFSEEQGNWYTEMDRVIEVDLPPNFDDIKRSMENGDFTGFMQLAKSAKTNYGQFIRLRFHRPPQPSALEPHYLCIEKVVLGQKNNKTGAPLVKYIAIGGHLVNELTSTHAAQNPVYSQPPGAPPGAPGAPGAPPPPRQYG